MSLFLSQIMCIIQIMSYLCAHYFLRLLMQIADIDLGSRPVMLAPMEDVTDQAFRIMCKQFGASMVYSEFVSADALIRSVNRSLEKIRIEETERPVAIQIYGRDTDSMVEAAKIVESEVAPDVIDINFGCPVKKIAAKGAGSGMLKTPQLMLEITRAVVNAVNTPVTVKTRLGWDVSTMHDAQILLPDAEKGRPYIVELAERLQDCGIAALTIHGRTRSQMYQGEADWTLIGEVKQNPRMRIPIIGNGDICTAEQCREAFDRYGVDAVMIGRATLGQPWLFKDIRSFLDTGMHDEQMTIDWKLQVLRSQVEQSVAYSLRSDNGMKEKRRTELGGIIHVRRHLANSPLFKGIPNFRELRIRILKAESCAELFSLLEQAREFILQAQST